MKLLIPFLMTAMLASPVHDDLSATWAALFADAQRKDTQGFAEHRALIFEREKAMVLNIGGVTLEMFDHGPLHFSAYSQFGSVPTRGGKPVYVVLVTSDEPLVAPTAWRLYKAYPAMIGFVWNLTAFSCDMRSGESLDGHTHSWRTLREDHPPGYSQVKQEILSAIAHHRVFPEDTAVGMTVGTACTSPEFFIPQRLDRKPAW